VRIEAEAETQTEVEETAMNTYILKIKKMYIYIYSKRLDLISGSRVRPLLNLPLEDNAKHTHTHNLEGLHTVNCRLQTVDCRLQTVDCED